MKGDPAKAKLLIVDDTPMNLDVLVGGLGDDYTVVAARDGKRALALAERDTQPDLILLDIMMPELDGYEVARRLKANERTRHIPIIFLTALADETNELQGLELGAVDYIHKPISIPLVKARVATHLELLAARRQLAAQVEQLAAAARLRDEIEQITRHDLKAPLTPIIWFARLLAADTSLAPQQRERAELIHGSALKMLEMINHSLDLYKMEMGRYRYAPVELDLYEGVLHVVSDFSELAAAHEVKLTVEGKPLHILGDDMLCYSLCGNLLKNAIEASPPGSEVTITLGRQGQQAEVAIHNSGAVPEGVRDHFFEKFSTAGKEGGSGLGTYSARLMTRTMGGEIEMKSSKAAGTTLRVRLPLA